MADKADKEVVLAAIAGAHGISGEVRLKSFAESVDALRAHRQVSVGGGTLTLLSVKPGGAGAIARFAGIADRAAAEALRGQLLSVPRSALPPLGEGEYYHADLIGLPCVSPAGETLGHVVAVENFGAGDLIEIETGEGRRALAPFRPGIAEFEEGRIVVDPAFLA